jgi:hypothetical protein
MLAQGEEQQALQLADAPPGLLDLVTRLAFRQSQDWRAFCQANDYPVAESFEGKFIRQLSEAYGKGLAPSHRLYADYREAVLRRHDEQAVAVLRAIARRNPQDTNAPRELERLENKILAARLDQLNATLTAGEEARAVALVEAIEALDFQAAPAGEAWRQGQTVRCRAVLGQARELRCQNQWEAAAPLLTLVASLVREHGLTLAADQAELLEELESWVAAALKASQEDARFHRAVLELRQSLNSWEEKQAAGQPFRRAELRFLLDALARKWREIEPFQRPVPEDLMPRLEKARSLLGAELDRRNRRVRKLAGLGVAGFALVAIVLSFHLFSARAARDFASQLGQARQHRQVAAAAQLAQQIRAQQPRLARGRALWFELTATDRFLTNEYALRAQCQTNLAWLQVLAGTGFAGFAPNQVQARLEALRQQVADVAADLQPPVREDLAGFERRWEEWLAQSREQAAQEVGRLLLALEQKAAVQLKYELGPEALRASLAGLDPEFTRLQALATPAVPQLRLPPELAARFGQLQKRLADVRAEVDKWGQVMDTWRRLPSVEAYVESLKAFRKSEFAPPAHLGLANEVLGLNVSATNFFAALLLPNQPETWDLFLRQSLTRFVPGDVLPAERGKLKLLLDDQNIHYVKPYKITEWALPTNELRRVRTIFVRGELTRRDRRAAPASDQVYDPAESPSLLVYKHAEYSSARFGFEDLGRPRERDIFERVRLKQLVDPDGARYLEPLLTILDAINRETEASPLFRAFLALRLQELMELRPADWGAAWTPALAADRQRLLELGAGAIQSGDWMCPERARALERPLEEHFQKARQVSYWQQARLVNELARRALAAGVTLIGRAEAAGNPVLNAPAAPAELWGWDAQRKPALLFRCRAADSPCAAVTPALPFTPLFLFRADRRQVVREVTQATAARPGEAGTYLPPLFAIPYE